MTRTRWRALVIAVSLVAAGGVAYGINAGDGATSVKPAPTATSTSVTVAGATTTTTTSRAATATAVAADGGKLGMGSHGPAVGAVQQRLIDLHLDPGPVDGGYGQATAYAVEAFEKLNGMAPDGEVGPLVQAALANPAAVTPLVPYGGATRVEIDLRRQVLFVYENDALRLITHVSTGTGRHYCVDTDCNNTAITPIGSFRFAWRATGWRESRLGKLYNPVYFTSDGVAVHGALSVPTYPASHGCVRIPMHIAEYFPTLVSRGDPVYVTDGRQVGPPAPTPGGPPPTDKPTSPGDDPSTTTSTTTTTTTTPASTTTTTTTTPATTTTTIPAATTTTSTKLLP